MTARELVDAGAAVLDVAEPMWEGQERWFDAVDPDRLDLSNARECVIGQWSGYYFYGLEHLGVGSMEARLLGFSVPLGGGIKKEELEAEWKMAILKRREMGGNSSG